MANGGYVRKLFKALGLGLCIVIVMILGYVLHFIYLANSSPDGRFAKQANDRIVAAPSAAKDGVLRGQQLTARLQEIADAIVVARAESGYDENNISFVFLYSDSIPPLAVEQTKAVFESLRASGVVDQARSIIEFDGAVLPAETTLAMNAQRYQAGLVLCRSLLEADFLLAAQRGDDDSAIAAIRANLSLAATSTRASLSFTRRFGNTTAMQTFQRIQLASEQGLLSKPLSEKLLPLIQSWSPALSPTQLIDLDTLEAHDSIDTLWERGPRGRVIVSNFFLMHPTLAGTPQKRTYKNIEGLWQSRRRDAEAAVADLRAYGLALIAAPLSTAARDEVAAPTALAAGTFWNAGFVMLTVTSYEHAIVQQAAVITTLAIELYRARTGSLPRTLDDLVPSVLAHLPENISAPDRRFIYKPGDGTNFLLYTPGPSGIDNLGKQATGNGPPYLHDAARDAATSRDFDLVYRKAK